MDFIRKNIPKQLNRNGYIVSNSYTSSYVSTANSSGSNIVAGNYLPAILNNGRYAVSVATDFYSTSPLWQWFKQTATIDETTSAETITNTSILKLEEDTLTLGEYEVLTTKYFYVDSSGRLHTPFSLVSDKEITAYSTGSGTSNTGTTGDATTSTVLVEDTLTSTSTTTALSANQGRVLKGLIDAIDAHSHDNKEALDTITATNIANWNTAVSNTHTHSNKSILDAITDTTIANWNTAYTNNHTHSTAKNVDAYWVVLGNYGGLRHANNGVFLQASDTDLTINALGRNLYLGSKNTSAVFFPVHKGTDEDGNDLGHYYNSISLSSNIYLQQPVTIALQTTNNTLPPIYTNSSNLCTNLNADKVDGYNGTDFVNAIAINGRNLTYRKGTTTTSLTIPFATIATRLISNDGEDYISLWEDNVNITGLGKHIYLGAQQYKNNNYKIYFVTNNGTEDTEGTVFWNKIDGTNFYTEVPHYINLKSGVYDTVAPIYINSTNKCTNLNADLLDGLHSDSFIKTSGDQVLNGNLTVNGYIKASGEVSAHNTSTATSSTSTINFADDVVVSGNVKCDSIVIADTVNISKSNNQTQIYIDAQAEENNAEYVYFNGTVYFRNSIDASESAFKAGTIQCNNFTNAKKALADVENATTIDEIKTILINLRNSL